MSLHVYAGDPTRIAAQVVTSIGFLYAGVILQFQGRIAGLTTAATLWTTASIGMYILAILTTGLVYGMLVLQQLPGWQNFIRKHLLKDRRERIVDQ